MKIFVILIMLAIVLQACHSVRKVATVNPKVKKDENPVQTKNDPNAVMLSMDRPLPIDRDTLLNYAKQFTGTPYLYASDDPAKGFDCSGFLFHVFKHFNVKAPRASADYERKGKDIPPANALPGDLVLFTADDPAKIGHIGIITDTRPGIAFIHASASRGVITSTLSGYYATHFVKIIRVLE